MPTGYTDEVQKGEITTLKQFAHRCARGMGALITMRDNSWSDPIPDQLEAHTSYHDEKLEDLRGERTRIYQFTKEQAEEEAEKEYDDDVARIQERLDEIKVQRQRYLDMLNKVKDWENPPEGIKSFMLEQLNTSINFDCDSSYWESQNPSAKSGENWRNNKINEIDKSIQYHEKARAEEIARTDSRNAWLQQLHRSLEGTD